MIKKTVAIIVLVTIVSLSVAGCTVNPSSTSSPTPTPIASKETVIGNNTTFSSAAGFNITYPKTLKIDSSTNASVPVRIYVYLGTNNTSAAVSVATDDLNPNTTLTNYTNFSIGQINDYPNYQLISNQSTTLGGKPAYNIVWQANIPVQVGTTVQNQTLKFMQTYVVNNNTGYVVYYKAIPSEYNTYLAQAQQIMNSFKFN
jgi:hypothetical protein